MKIEKHDIDQNKRTEELDEFEAKFEELELTSADDEGSPVIPRYTHLQSINLCFTKLSETSKLRRVSRIKTMNLPFLPQLPKDRL